MKSLPINPVLAKPNQLNDLTQTIHAAEKEQWMQSLTAGQIIKGRILRQYADQRYGVSFAGQERIVDSSIPLAVGDVLTGKVIGVSEQAASMKLISGRAASKSSLESDQLKPQVEGGVQAEMANHGLNLNAAQQQIISQASDVSSDAHLAIRVGVFLAKLGLPLSLPLIEAVLKKISEIKPAAPEGLMPDIPELQFVSSHADLSEAPPVIESPALPLADYFAKQFLVESIEQDKTHIEDPLGRPLSSEQVDINERQQGNYSDANSAFSFQHIFNQQTDSEVQHRFHTLPVMIDGRLIEFDVALFDQKSSTHEEEGLMSKRLKFSLETEFGVVSLDAQVINQHVNLQILSQSQEMVALFDAYATTLAAEVAKAGWVLDQQSSMHGEAINNAAREVMEHVLAQGSLHMVM